MDKDKKTDKRKKVLKGECGYIDLQKKKRLLRVVMYCLIGVAIFVLGLCLNKFEKSNIFSVIAILMVLPAAKALVGFIVLMPFQSVDQERVKRVESMLSGGDILYTDMVFTSTEKVMFFAFLAITEDEVICLAGREKEDTAYMEKYLKAEFKRRMFSRKLYITKDEEKFLSHVGHSAPAKEVPEELTSYLISLMV